MGYEILLDEKVNDNLLNIKKGYLMRNIEDKFSLENLELYKSVLANFSNNTRNTPQQMKCLDAYEHSLAIFIEASASIRKIMDIKTYEQKLEGLKVTFQENNNGSISETIKAEQEKTLVQLEKDISDAKIFANRYALYIAGEMGLALLGTEKSNINITHYVGSKYDNDNNSSELIGKLTEYAAKTLKKQIDDVKTANIEITDTLLEENMSHVFTSWINQFNWKTFQSVTNKYELDDLQIKYGSYTASKGSFTKKNTIISIDDMIMKTRRSDIIGGGKIEEGIWDGLFRLAHYDFDAEMNAAEPPFVIFIFGEPGGGKTFIAHSLLREFYHFCLEKKIPLSIINHSVTDYASHYQNLTAIHLNDFAKGIRTDKRLNVIYIPDAHAVFSSIKDSDSTQELRQTQSVYYKMTDGTMIPKNGRVLFIIDANFVDTFDPASKSRMMTDTVFEMKRFTAPENFRDYAKKKITSKLEEDFFKQEQWMDLGNYLFETPLSNREIDNILKSALGGAKYDDTTLENKQYDKLKRIRNDQLKKIITIDSLKEKFENYITTMRDIELSSQEARYKDDAAKYIEYLITKADRKKSASSSL